VRFGNPVVKKQSNLTYSQIQLNADNTDFTDLHG
jgi:hypothetical protein